MVDSNMPIGTYCAMSDRNVEPFRPMRIHDLDVCSLQLGHLLRIHSSFPVET